MTAYTFAPRARRDLQAAWTYSRDRWGRRRADAYVRDLTAIVEHIAANPLLGQACDEVALLHLASVALVEYGLSTAMAEAVETARYPARLATLFEGDPVLLARLALFLASVKRHPKLGPPLTRWLEELYEPAVATVYTVLEQLRGGLPALEALTARYLDKLAPNRIRSSAAERSPRGANWGSEQGKCCV